MKFYYVNIDKSKDRRQFMENQFKSLGIENYERIKGITENIVDSYAHPDDLVDEKYVCDPTEDKKYFKDCPNCRVERAILQSHLKAIERGVENEDEYFIILEDDTVIPYNIDYELFINKFVPKDWEVIQMFCSNPITVKKMYEILKEHGQLFIEWRMIIPCAGAYLVKREAGKRIIEKYKKDRKWRFKDTDYCRLSDAMIFQIMKTYVCTYQFFYSDVKLGSLVHPDHLKSHEFGMNVIKQIMENSGEKPFEFIKNKYIM
jgi:GR25 family glycosyltransferase involved in LPS biosynthesis